MDKIDSEKEIFEESPDFEAQREILGEEKNERERLKNFYFYIGGIFFCILLILIIAHITIDIYIEYSVVSSDACENVNIKLEKSEFDVINIAFADSCVPKYNIDYYNNRLATFNIDLYGDKSLIYNKMNQMDETGSYCTLNCDKDNDGWPDYNIDLNGDGVADLNIVKNPWENTTCDLNCDINYDTLPDTNIDTNGDGTADVNITNGDYTKPEYNIDYKGNRLPTFNIKMEDGTISNPVTDATKHNVCTLNCDANGDGWPDYNIKLPESDILLNEVVSRGDVRFPNEDGKNIDWKCFHSKGLIGCISGATFPQNTYINIDVNGDGHPDVNISSDGGKTIANPLNHKTNINGKYIILNEDLNKDGFPDYNIDINNDGLPDLNVTNGLNHICTKNCDTNKDGKPDYKIEFNNDSRHQLTIKNINIDIDYDSTCDVNCDKTYDLYPDFNIDVTGDNVPDINIDYDGDKVPDFNIDTDGDGFADKNLSAYLDGTCNWNCDDKENIINTGSSCGPNCDTDDDGWPNLDIDLDGDNICDINCNKGPSNLDKNGDYFIDEETHIKDMHIDRHDKTSFYVLNPIDIVARNIEPGWKDTYVLTITNNTHYAMKYRLYWTKVLNEFTDENNLEYFITRNGGKYIDITSAPRDYNIIKDNLLIRANTTIKYVMQVSWKETDQNQNIDSGKRFKGELRVETIK